MLSTQDKVMMTTVGIILMILAGVIFLTAALAIVVHSSSVLVMDISVVLAVIGGSLFVGGLSWTYIAVFFEDRKHNRNGEKSAY